MRKASGLGLVWYTRDVAGRFEVQGNREIGFLLVALCITLAILHVKR